jgi:multiple antibiotic resistance protein
MTTNLLDILTIFFLTLGPIKVIPVFFNLTMAASPAFRRQTAFQSIAIATAICLFISIIGVNILRTWQVSLNALRIAGGLILLLSALKAVSLRPETLSIPPENTESSPSAIALALSPLSIPVIVTPYGVVAILFFMSTVRRNFVIQGQVFALILLVMFLNYWGMIFADKIMKTIGFPALRLLGWVLAVMQSALAIDIILRAFQSMGVIDRLV